MPQQDWTADIEAKRTQLRQSRHTMRANIWTTENYALHAYACLRAEQALLANRAIRRENDWRSWRAVMAKRQWLYRELGNVDLEQARQGAADAAIDADGNHFYAAYAAYCCANQDIGATAQDVIAAAACSLAMADSHALRDLAASPQPALPTVQPAEHAQVALCDTVQVATGQQDSDEYRLSQGHHVFVPSRLFPELEYVISPVVDAPVRVIRRIGAVGTLSISLGQPAATILTVKLRLCQTDEERLWRRSVYTPLMPIDTLPTRIREWMSLNRFATTPNRSIADALECFCNPDDERVWRRNVYTPPMPIDTLPIRRTERAVSDADTQALELLRRAGPEGKMLAREQAVRVKSQLFNGMAYVIEPDARACIAVVCDNAGIAGSICIQPTEAAPPADILLSKLRLCQADETKLWTVGNYGIYEQGFRLPPQLVEWINNRRVSLRR